MNIELENKIMELVEAIQADQFPESEIDPETGLVGPEYCAYEDGECIHSITLNIHAVRHGAGVDVSMHLQWPRFHMLYHELKRAGNVINLEASAIEPEWVHVRMSVADSIIKYVAVVYREECIDMLMERGVPDSTLEADLAGPACEAAAEDLWNEVLKYECL